MKMTYLRRKRKDVCKQENEKVFFRFLLNLFKEDYMIVIYITSLNIKNKRREQVKIDIFYFDCLLMVSSLTDFKYCWYFLMFCNPVREHPTDNISANYDLNQSNSRRFHGHHFPELFPRAFIRKTRVFLTQKMLQNSARTFFFVSTIVFNVNISFYLPQHASMCGSSVSL